jgi:uracil-DNA glycosylase family protein
MSVAVERTLEQLREQAAGCRACDLWRCATQTVFGEGPPDAPIMLVGEEPGDQEDKHGHPFVGPAGRILDQALALAEMDRSTIFATNAVKHFKYRMRGKRRIHQRPNAAEVAACRQWLTAEVELVSPAVIVALGATAAHSLLGHATAIGENRGRVLESPLFAPPVLVTAHPSSVLRERDSEARRAALAALAEDLRVAAQFDGASDGRDRQTVTPQ